MEDSTQQANNKHYGQIPDIREKTQARKKQGE